MQVPEVLCQVDRFVKDVLQEEPEVFCSLPAVERIEEHELCRPCAFACRLIVLELQPA